MDCGQAVKRSGVRLWSGVWLGCGVKCDQAVEWSDAVD